MPMWERRVSTGEDVRDVCQKCKPWSRQMHGNRLVPQKEKSCDIQMRKRASYKPEECNTYKRIEDEKNRKHDWR